MTYADLELSLRRWSGDDYAVELRLQLVGSGAESHLIPGAPPRVRIDFEQLLEFELDPPSYGAALTGMLCADPRVTEALARARYEAEAADIPLRLRLRLDADNDEIHTPRWETLRDPGHGGFLFASERMLLSRYLDSADMRPIAQHPRVDLKALVVVANPAGLADYKLAPVDVLGEVARSQAALTGIGTRVLARAITGQAATLNNLAAALRDGPDILYLVAHGTLRRGRPFVWLEDDGGAIMRVEGEELVETIERLTRRPLLVVLASCQSAGTGQDNGTLAALGPRLAAAGIAATVAMQGNVSMATVEQFMPLFFTELRRDGQIDRALAAARAAVLRRADWWMPVLFLRVRNGLLWAEAAPARSAANTPPPPSPERPPEGHGFIGRASELAVYQARLAAQHITVITGMPGVGKTSLAAMLARAIAPSDAIFWHSFNSGEGIDTLVWALAGFLAHNGQAELWGMLQGARQSGGQPPPTNVLFDYLLEMLRGRGYVLCLDDFSFVDQDVQLEQFVERLRPELHAGGIRLIMTSRRVPEFLEEPAIAELAGLSAADVSRLLDARGVGLSDTLRAELHTQTGGNAQLLTLASDALGRAPDPARVIARLTEADNIERYLLKEVDAGLSGDERQVMQAVAVLLDYGGTRGAIEVLLDGSSVRRTLRALTDRYLLITHEGPYGKEHRLHALVQSFYYGDLGRRERVAMHQRAGAYYQADERDPLRAAIHYDRAGDAARAADLATADIWALINAGQARALCRFLERFIARQPEPDTARQLDPERWAAVLVAIGNVYEHLGDRQLAHQMLQEADERLASLPDTLVMRRLKARVCLGMGASLRYEAPQLALEWLRRGLDSLGQGELQQEAAALEIITGSAQMRIGAYQAAIEAVHRGLALLPASPSQLHAEGLNVLGITYGWKGDIEQRDRYTAEALDVCRQLHDSVRIISILSNLAVDKYVAGEWAQAIADSREALSLAEQIGNQSQQIMLEQNLGIMLVNTGDDMAALGYLTECLARARANQFVEYEIGCLTGLADLHLRRNEAETALPLLAEAERLIVSTDIKYRLSELHRFWTQAHLAQGRTAPALDAAERALQQAREMDEPFEEGLSLRIHGQARGAAGQRDAALTAFERSLELLADDPYEAARTQVQLAAALRERGGAERARELFGEAQTIFARLGAQRDLAEVRMYLVEGHTGQADTADT
jgi:tetratricopeptide (TPR) repeat protein